MSRSFERLLSSAVCLYHSFLLFIYFPRFCRRCFCWSSLPDPDLTNLPGDPDLETPLDVPLLTTGVAREVFDLIQFAVLVAAWLVILPWLAGLRSRTSLDTDSHRFSLKAPSS